MGDVVNFKMSFDRYQERLRMIREDAESIDANSREAMKAGVACGAVTNEQLTKMAELEVVLRAMTGFEPFSTVFADALRKMILAAKGG